MKFYILGDVETGYILNAEIHTGSHGSTKNYFITECLLCNNYLGQGQTIYMDHFYTSAPIFDMLWEQKTSSWYGDEKSLSVTKGSVTYETQERRIFWCKSICFPPIEGQEECVYSILSTQHKMTTLYVSVPTKQG